jgi:hypothetical protein
MAGFAWPGSVVTMAAFAGSESVVTSMAGFDGFRRPHPGIHTTTPAARRYALAVSRRTPVACSIRRTLHPSFPSAMTCCCFSVLKTLLMSTEPIRPCVVVNVPSAAMAGFQVTLYGRFWVTPEEEAKTQFLGVGIRCILEINRRCPLKSNAAIVTHPAVVVAEIAKLLGRAGGSTVVRVREAAIAGAATVLALSRPPPKESGADCSVFCG